MNARVAHDASLHSRVGVRALRELVMALETQRVDACGEQHARIDRGVRGVAGHASLNPDGFVLEDERSTFVGVALVAHQVLIGRRPHLAISQRAVRIVAIGALDQALVHTMAEGLLEIGPLFRVARVTRLGLLAGQQIFPLAVVDGVATGATDAVLVVR